MAEINLICPGCGAEYALPPDALPPTGREVECSDCGHVWQARPPAPEGRLDLAGFGRPRGGAEALRFDEDDPRPAPPLPPASQRLSADVLDILRDEVEHERRLRAAEAPPPPAAAAADGIDWPATTVVLPDPGGPAAPTVIRHPAPRATPEPRPDPSPAQPVIAVPPDRVPPEPGPTEPGPQNAAASKAAHPAAARSPQGRSANGAPPAARPARRGGFALGFVLALTVAAAVVAVYLLAPALAGREDALSRMLLSWRADLDALRLWLAQAVGR